MSNAAEEKQFGFVCPKEFIPHWNQNECTIEECTDGTFVVLDHSIQTVVYVGHTRKECSSFQEWLQRLNP